METLKENLKHNLKMEAAAQKNKSKETGAADVDCLSLFRNSDPDKSVLRTWLRHFDPDANMIVTFDEFLQGCLHVGYTGDVVELFRSIDTDGSGELGLDEIDGKVANLWSTFRLWSVQSFESIRDMLKQLSGGAQTL